MIAPAGGHGVARVDDQVEQRQFELVEIASTQCAPGSIVEFDLMVVADRLVEHRPHFGEQHGHVDRRDLELLAARESQQLRGQLARSLGRGERAVGNAPRALVEIGRA